jgi:hypothetical protein
MLEDAIMRIAEFVKKSGDTPQRSIGNEATEGGILCSSGGAIA